MKRSPAAAFWLSLLPGLGHIYLGLVGKGAVFALLTVGLIDIVDRGTDAFGILVPIYWVFVMLDAHRNAHAINRGDVSGDTFTGPGAKWWGGSLIVLGVLFLLYNFDLFDFDWLWQFWPLALIVIGIKLIRFPASTSTTTPSAPEPPPPVPETPEEDRVAATEAEPTAADDPSSDSSEQGDIHDRPEVG
jgi:hypothetical protein